MGRGRKEYVSVGLGVYPTYLGMFQRGSFEGFLGQIERWGLGSDDLVWN